MRLAWLMERTGHCCSFSGRFGHGSSRMLERARHTSTCAWKRPHRHHERSESLSRLGAMMAPPPAAPRTLRSDPKAPSLHPEHLLVQLQGQPVRKEKGRRKARLGPEQSSAWPHRQSRHSSFPPQGGEALGCWLPTPSLKLIAELVDGSHSTRQAQCWGTAALKYLL